MNESNKDINYQISVKNITPIGVAFNSVLPLSYRIILYHSKIKKVIRNICPLLYMARLIKIIKNFRGWLTFNSIIRSLNST